MRKLLIISILIPLLVKSQYTYVPDDNFEQTLLNFGLDAVLDDYVSTSAIDTITSLYIPNKSIQDLTGIEDFIAIRELFCNNNDLVTLNLSNNTELFEVVCSNNNLISLDLRNGNNPALYAVSSMNNSSLSCIDVDDPDLPILSYWWIDTWISFSNECNPTSIRNTSINKKLVKITDINGRIVRASKNTPLLYIFSDGTVKKKIIIE